MREYSAQKQSYLLSTAVSIKQCFFLFRITGTNMQLADFDISP